MIYLIIITWYLIGAFSLIWIGRKIDGRTTRKDLIFALAIGGLGGIITLFVGLPYLMNTDWMNTDWMDEDVF